MKPMNRKELLSDELCGSHKFSLHREMSVKEIEGTNENGVPKLIIHSQFPNLTITPVAQKTEASLKSPTEGSLKISIRYADITPPYRDKPSKPKSPTVSSHSASGSSQSLPKGLSMLPVVPEEERNLPKGITLLPIVPEEERNLPKGLSLLPVVSEEERNLPKGITLLPVEEERNLPKGLSLVPVVPEQERSLPKGLSLVPVLPEQERGLPKGLSLLPVVAEQERESVIKDSMKITPVSVTSVSEKLKSETEKEPQISKLEIKLIKHDPECTDDLPVPEKSPELTKDEVVVNLAVSQVTLPSSPEISSLDSFSDRNDSPIPEQDIRTDVTSNCELTPSQEECSTITDCPNSPNTSLTGDTEVAPVTSHIPESTQDIELPSETSTPELSEIGDSDGQPKDEPLPPKQLQVKSSSESDQAHGPPKHEAGPVSVIKRKARLKISPRLSDTQRNQRLALLMYGAEPTRGLSENRSSDRGDDNASPKTDNLTRNGVGKESSLSNSDGSSSSSQLPTELLPDCVVRVARLNPTVQRLFLRKLKRQISGGTDPKPKSAAKNIADTDPKPKEAKVIADNESKSKEIQIGLGTDPKCKDTKIRGDTLFKDTKGSDDSTQMSESEETRPPGGQSPKKSEGKNKGRSTLKKRKASAEREAIPPQGGKILRIKNGDEVMCTKVMNKKVEPSEKTRCTFCGKLTQSTNVWKHLLAVYKVNADIDEAIDYEWGAELFKCSECGASLCSKAALGIHFHHLHSKTSQYECKCPCCSETFLTDVSLACHLATHCKDILKECCLSVPPILNPPSLLHCGLCRKSYKTIEDLESHLKGHNSSLKGNQCKVCFKRFSKSYQLKCHMVVHTQLRPFKCEQCEKTFRFRSSLRTHNYSHIGVQPYKCKVCDKGFFESGNMVKHMRKAHKENTGLIPDDPAEKSSEKKVSTIKLVKVKTSNTVSSDDKESNYMTERDLNEEPGSSTDSRKTNGVLKSAFKIISLKKKNPSILAKELKKGTGFKKKKDFTNTIKMVKLPLKETENTSENKQSMPKLVLRVDSPDRQSQKVVELKSSNLNHNPLPAQISKSQFLLTHNSPTVQAHIPQINHKPPTVLNHTPPNHKPSPVLNQNTVDSTTPISASTHRVPQQVRVVPNDDSEVVVLQQTSRVPTSIQQPLRIVPSVEQRLRIVPSIDQHLRIVPSVEQQLRIVSSMENQIAQQQLIPPVQQHPRMRLTVEHPQFQHRPMPIPQQQPRVVSSTLWVPQAMQDLHHQSPALQQLEHMSRTMIRVPTHNTNVIYPNQSVNAIQQHQARNIDHSSLLFNLLTAKTNVTEAEKVGNNSVNSEVWANGPPTIVGEWGDVPATVELIPNDVIEIRKNCILCETVCVTTIEMTDHLLYYHRVSMRKVNDLVAACCKL